MASLNISTPSTIDQRLVGLGDNAPTQADIDRANAIAQKVLDTMTFGVPTSNGSTASNTNLVGGGDTSAKVLDQAQLDSLQSLLDSYDAERAVAKRRATLTRDTNLAEKKDEFGREKGKYEGKKLSTLQDFGTAKVGTDINTRNTLENLISSLSTMGLGGTRALTRQILDASNRSNRLANETQAHNSQDLDSAFNEYTAGNQGDIQKINDQFGYDTGEADRKWGQNRQTDLYKQADVYNAADDSVNRERLMKEGNNLNKFITDSAFLNPSYTGAVRQMATPELSNYTQNIARYDTRNIGGVTPAGGAAAVPGNIAVRAVALNDKDFGVKKKTEGELAYGV
jgi:hypothetical protein